MAEDDSVIAHKYQVTLFESAEHVSRRHQIPGREQSRIYFPNQTILGYTSKQLEYITTDPNDLELAERIIKLEIGVQVPFNLPPLELPASAKDQEEWYKLFEETTGIEGCVYLGETQLPKDVFLKVISTYAAVDQPIVQVEAANLHQDAIKELIEILHKS